MRRAAAWLERHPEPDGGWGEDGRSYDDPAWSGRGASTASQTAWALLALRAARRRDRPWSAAWPGWSTNQRADGDVGRARVHRAPASRGDFYINYHLYRLELPGDGLGALGGGRRAELGRGRRGIRRDDGEPGGATPGHSRRGARLEEVMARAGGENFPVASRLLGARLRDSLLAIYGFARLVDQVGDEVAGDRLALLDWLDSEIDRIYAGGMPDIPPCAGWRRSPVSRTSPRSRSTAWSRPTALTRP